MKRPVMILGAALVAGVLAIFGQATETRLSSDNGDITMAALDPDDGLDANMLWLLAAANGAPLTEADVEARLTKPFLAEVPAQEFLAATRSLTIDGPYTLHSIDRRNRYEQTALLQAADGQGWVIELTGDPVDNTLLNGAFILGTEVKIGPFSDLGFTLHLVAGLALITAGVVTGRRPGSNLMVAAGFVWLAQLLELSDAAVLFTTGLVAAPFGLALAGHGVVRYLPGTPLRAPGNIVVVAIGYVAAAAATLPLLAIDTTVWSLPRNLLAVGHDQANAKAWSTVALAAGVVAVATVAGEVIRRIGQVSVSVRRHLLPVGIGAVTVATVVIGLAVVSLFVQRHVDLSYSSMLSGSVCLLGAGIVVARATPRLQLGEVAAMVADLGGAPAPDALRASLARALDDPAVQLVYWSPVENHYVSAEGAKIDVDTIPDGRAVTWLKSEDEALGAVIHDQALLSEPDRVGAACAAVKLALHNERLRTIVTAQLEEVQASRTRIVESAEAARRSLERDLHDGTQQRLLSLQLAVTAEHSRLSSSNPEAAAFLSQMIDELRLTLDEVRELGRGLHPSNLDRGLAAAVEALAERSSLPLVATVADSNCRDDVQVAAYYVIAEAVTNATRHSDADHVRVDVSCDDGQLRVNITDNGCGGATTPGRATPQAATNRPSGGLTNMRDRVEALGGTFTVSESAPGTPRPGTSVESTMPCE